jgi:hypothetical protein
MEYNYNSDEINDINIGFNSNSNVKMRNINSNDIV